jgi:ABC-type dipeptide/oligopeptide/nickel transport system permease subunit
MTICSGLAIAVLVLGFNFLGDGPRDALDPATKKRSGF